MKHHYALIIPALDEEQTIGLLLAQIPAALFDQLIVVDNGSRDLTPATARAAGATVVTEPRRGYGQACMAGLSRLSPQITAVAFMDADLSDDVRDLKKLVVEFESRDLDLIIGSRVLSAPEPRSLTFLQRFGNWLSTRMIRIFFGVAFTDLGPMRIIRREALESLSLRDRNFGWNVEMQARAAQRRLKVAEAPVDYRRRQGGRSKISGTITGSLKAGIKILWTLFQCWRARPASPSPRT
jgi:glycosyltransferase involved in cell wall biosynthesis